VLRDKNVYGNSRHVRLYVLQMHARKVLESFGGTCSKTCHPCQHLPFLPFVAMQWEPDGVPVWQQVAEAQNTGSASDSGSDS
jgi:hypothetical protein